MSYAETDSLFSEPVHVAPYPGAKFVVLCEHASHRIPAGLDLGLAPEVTTSHAAWDPGALGVAKALAERLEAALIYGGMSRLLYDCNRPPEAPSAMPEKSEIYEIPGNQGLSDADRQARVDGIYAPFCAAVAETLAQSDRPVLVTMHSFTPVFKGAQRAVEIGVLHGRDPALAQAMMAHADMGHPFNVQLNEPYGPQDGVAHSLDLHGSDNGLSNVMIEIRNDLIRTPEEESAMAALLAPWILQATADLPESSR
jgi:predicted N-formylglutamate amidohydrolase